MLGAIIGDICGSVYEFKNEKNISRIKLFAEEARPTDDTVMTVAVAAALTENYGRSTETIREALIDAMHYYGRMYPRDGYGGTFIRWLMAECRNPYGSYGNGSAMRVSPAGWLYDSLEETLSMAALTAEVTHNHPEGIKGAQAVAAAIYLARTGKSKEEIKEYITENFYALDFTLDEIREEYAFDVSCQGSCPQAIEAFLEGDSFEDVIRLAISLGGDSDTIAAMAGCMAEAFWGIPEDMEETAMEILSFDTDRLSYAALRDAVLQFRNFLERKEKDRLMPEGGIK